MRDWCVLSEPEHIMQGDFWEARVVHNDGLDLHVDDAFMEALAFKVMNHYESINESDDTLFLPSSLIATRDRTKIFYEPLFNDDGTCRPEFVVEASETLGLWIEQSLEGAIYAKRGTPHNSEFGFDVLSVASDGDYQFVRIVQVKATRSNLYGRCREGAMKFGELHSGKYASVLKAHLEALRYDRMVPAEVNLDELFLRRRYRIITVHEEARDGVTLLANFATQIPGTSECRTLRLVRIVWNDFWNILAGKVYAQLS